MIMMTGAYRRDFQRDLDELIRLWTAGEHNQVFAFLRGCVPVRAAQLAVALHLTILDKLGPGDAQEFIARLVNAPLLIRYGRNSSDAGV